MTARPGDTQFGPFRLCPLDRRLLQDGHEISLTPKAFDTLQVLVRHAGELVEKKDLMKAVWGETFVDDNTLTQNIFTIRKALGDALYIETVPRRGYRFTAVVTTLEPLPESAATLPSEPSANESHHKIGLPWIAAGIVGGVVAVTLASWVFIRLPYNPLDGAPPYIPVTNSEGDEFNGTISRDGRFLVYVSDHAGTFDNLLVNLATREQSPWGKSGNNETSVNLVRSLGFTRDGSRWSEDLSGTLAEPLLGVMPIEGGEVKPFLGNQAREPAWSADGRFVVYHLQKDGDAIYVADYTGANSRKIFENGDATIHNHLLAWSTDGEWIYFTRGVLQTMKFDIWRIRPDGGGQEQLTHHGCEVSYPNPIDERTLLYLACDEKGLGPWLWALDVESKTSRRISSGSEEFIALSSTADGRRLAATIARPTAKLLSVPILDGAAVAKESDVKPLEVGRTRALSPRFAHRVTGGDSLFFLSSDGGGDGLWHYRDKKLIEKWKGNDSALFAPPVVSPDGRQIAIALHMNGRTVWNIGSTEGSDFRPVGEGLEIQGSATWDPESKYLLAGGSVGKVTGLYQIPAAGGAPLLKVPGVALNPSWSREAGLIVYSGSAGGGRAALHFIQAKNFQPVEFPTVEVNGSSSQTGRFLSNGKGLIYRLGKDFWFLNLETPVPPHQLTNLSASSIGSFDIAPGGKEIVFDRLRQNSDIYLIDLPPKPWYRRF